MSRYIDAEKLLKKNEWVSCMSQCDYALGCRDVIQDIKEAPTEDVAEVIHSRYVHLGGDEWSCAVCGAVVHTEGSWDRPSGKYCSECGARMDGDEK